MTEELFLHLYAQNSTLLAMVQILASFATSNALQRTPRLKGVLSQVLPILGNVKDQHQPIFANDIIVAPVLSRNRNFEGHLDPLTRANYLASPPLVVAYALVDIDIENEPIRTTKDGNNA
ncbi:unnamed protein product [Lactuca saligna]|uniref:Aconitase/3-isopropylmalate dehydratase large subunit alpha/beta/alpha domain-containing protein n=1 Tax=Lactuca saligna TaxID=75948 RepID=A0AA36EF20_LACSI|nr:unnamed protein product [Lactuca saligna]